MSEADLIYTETLMQRGKENYEGKEIVILGGGDGGLLWELLKENPKHVTMLEVDDFHVALLLQSIRNDRLYNPVFIADWRRRDESLQPIHEKRVRRLFGQEKVFQVRGKCQPKAVLSFDNVDE